MTDVIDLTEYKQNIHNTEKILVWQCLLCEGSEFHIKIDTNSEGFYIRCTYCATEEDIDALLEKRKELFTEE